jgi:hypothetical protein
VAAIVLLGSVSVAMALPEIPADKFEPAENCGCHSAFLDQWKVSMHAKALDDPLYQLKLEKANKATDGALGPFCDACHAPVAIMGGLDTAGELPPQGAQGVGCSFCHQVTGTNEPIGNTSQQVTADGVYRAQFDDAVSPYHETAYSAFHETAEFCGACHNVDHPANGLHLEATYTEWKNGPYAKEGIVCQDCHMTPGPGPTKPNPGSAAAGGPQRDHIYIMTFAGGNVGLGDAALAEERLKAAAEIEVVAPDVVAPGEKAEAEVTITNVGAGHYLPTGLTEVRQMWLEVTATEPDGEPELIGEHIFGTVLKDADGNAPVELWEAVDFESDDRIPPKESVTDTFEFTMPDDGEVALEATLYYRSCSEEMAEEAGVEIPTTTMYSVQQAVWGSEDQKAEGTTPDASGSGGSNLLMYLVIGAIVGAAAVFVIWLVRRNRTA